MSLHSDTVSLFAGSGRLAKGLRSASGAPCLHQRCNVRTEMPISSQANCWRAPLSIASSTSLIIMPRFTVLVRHPRPLAPKSHECFFLEPVSYTHLRAHETRHDLVCRLLLEKKKPT